MGICIQVFQDEIEADICDTMIVFERRSTVIFSQDGWVEGTSRGQWQMIGSGVVGLPAGSDKE
jgi:hypothetical protein